MATTVLEKCKISPPSDSVPPEFTLPVVFLDMVFYNFESQSVLFFDFPCSKSHFLDTIVPELKKSLSITLTHFLPLAGNVIHPLNPAGDELPIIRYQSGDSVCFKVSESIADFENLTGNHSRDCDEFYGFVPHLPRAIRSETSISCPVLALQVTLFPGKGLCFGYATHHAVADASTVVSFVKAWALINTNRPSDNVRAAQLLSEGSCVPDFNRTTVKNLHGLDSIYWKVIVKLSTPAEPPPAEFPTNKHRETFIMKKDEIQKLKNFIAAKCPGVAHLSSFTVICALFWVCSAKSAGPGGEEVADNEPECFCFVADCRERLKPPLPANYFGSCLAIIKTELKHGVVKGPDGFVTAAMAIRDAIKENVYNDDDEKGILRDAENWVEEYEKSMIRKRQYWVSGSPRFDFYPTDYGWGKPKKFEALFTDIDKSMYLSKSRDFEGGIEFSLSRTKVQIDAFSRIFGEVLTDLLQ